MSKVAIVTGGSRGIGKGCALELAKAGLDIAITYVGNDEAANQTIKEIEEQQPEENSSNLASDFDAFLQKSMSKTVNDVKGPNNLWDLISFRNKLEI